MKKAATLRLALSVLVAGTIAVPAHAGIPVIVDLGVNTAQTIMGTIEETAQTLKQIEEYRTQLEQYENMLQNTAAPAMYIWDQAQTTINNLMAAQDTLRGYRTRLGSIQAYLDKYRDVNYYRSSPCFTTAGCSDAQRRALDQNTAFASEAQKKANDGLIKNIDAQQNNLQADAGTLRRLQSAAQGADGQMQALGYANQLASQQANQLLQIRSALLAQQNAVAAKMQADADTAAQQDAAQQHSSERRGPATLPARLTRW